MGAADPTSPSGEAEWSWGALVPSYSGEMNSRQPVVPPAERQYHRATAITLSCKRQEVIFIALSGSFLLKTKKKNYKEPL